MQLGKILEGTPGDPIIRWPVEFHLLKQMAGAEPRRFRVRAILLPVSEADRQQSKRDALDYLRGLSAYAKQDGGFYPHIPERTLEEESSYRFLCYAMRDEDEPGLRFVRNEDYESFRRGVVVEQVNWLKDQYDKLIDQEYPELKPEPQGATQEEKNALVVEAQGK